MKIFVTKSTSLFPLWVILFSFWAFLEPQYWSSISFLIVPLLSLVMFSMGLTLKVEDFLRILKNFKIVCVGIFLGFYFCKKMNYTNKIAKTMAIEIGMQNSGLATALAMKYFGPLSALAGAFFSIWHNISGPILASFWKKKNYNNRFN